PYKVEAGTPNIGDTVAFKAALEYIQSIGKAHIRKHEDELLRYATEQLLQINGLKIIGTARNKISVISFVIDGVHPQDVGILLDNKGIAIRTGHHCAQPLMDLYKIPGTMRASFAVYNTIDEVDKLVEGLQKAVKLLV
ncbi:MAG TPA: aminotransferase class V-fold PLP-dependent enzyme, partial [Niabella sp.]|nr:aminotransferase class V-fold PLP-dependent enzyme [Niabella sp.]